jgi:hypothetical protein
MLTRTWLRGPPHSDPTRISNTARRTQPATHTPPATTARALPARIRVGPAGPGEEALGLGVDEYGLVVRGEEAAREAVGVLESGGRLRPSRAALGYRVIT